MDQKRKSTTQQDLAAILGNPEALHMLAFGVKTMGKFIETGKAMSRLAFTATGLVPNPPRDHDGPPRTDHTGPRANGASAPAPSADAASDGEQTMVVPVSAWNRILEQLGNLHEAGQQLAEARERAARAEATAEFQSERRRQAEADRDRLVEENAQLLEIVRTGEIDLRERATADEARPAGDDRVHSRTDRVRVRLVRLLER